MDKFENINIDLPQYSLLIPVVKRKMSETNEIIQLYLHEKHKTKIHKKLYKKIRIIDEEKNITHKKMKIFIINNNVTRDRFIEIFHNGETQEELDNNYFDITDFLKNEVTINENHYLKIKNI
jgi:hypothetical protein